MGAESSGEQEHPPSTGMFPDKPMEKCDECRRWSYLAAITGRCLACVNDLSGSSEHPR